MRWSPRACKKSCARERTSTGRAARNYWSRSGTHRNGAKRHAATTPTGSSTGADWLDIRQRTDDDISVARREYERLAGSATVMSDIPPPQCDGRTGTPAPVTTGPGVGDRPARDHAGAKVVNGRGVQEHQVRPEDIPDAHRCTAASGVSRCWARSLIPRSIFWLITKLTASAGSTRNRAHGLV